MSQSSLRAAPEVSVVVPAYNAAATIGEVLASVFAERSLTIEVILVDDGSTDDTARVALAAQRPGDRCELHVLRHPGAANRGVAASRNLGFAHARAPFVAFLDADDWLLPGSLVSRVQVLCQHPDAALVYGRVRTPSADRAPGGFVGRGVAGRPFSLSRWLLFENPIPTSTVMVRRCAVPEPSFPEGLRHQMEDWAAWLSISQRGLAFFIDQDLAVYRQTSVSWTTQLDDRWVRHAQLREEADLLRRFLDGPLSGSASAVGTALAYRSGQLCVEALGRFGRLSLSDGRRCLASTVAIAGSKRVLARAIGYWVPRLKLRSWLGGGPATGPAWRDFIAS